MTKISEISNTGNKNLKYCCCCFKGTWLGRTFEQLLWNPLNLNFEKYKPQQNNESDPLIQEVPKENGRKTKSNKQIFKAIYKKIPKEYQNSKLFPFYTLDSLDSFNPEKEKVIVRAALIEATGMVLDEKLDMWIPQNPDFEYASNMENPPIHRYCDILPYAYNSDPKFHSSEIFLHGQSYLATQGPMKHTLKNFWEAIISKKVDCIVNLTMAIDIQRNQIISKCFNYWKLNSTFRIDDTTQVECQEENVLFSSENGQRIVLRNFGIYKLEGNQTRLKKIISQFHYENWPDQGVPDTPCFLELIRHSSFYRFPLVHCSAGIGRTGVFIVTNSLIKGILKENDRQEFSLAKTLFDLRLQRMGCVQGNDQFRAIQEALLAWKKSRA